MDLSGLRFTGDDVRAFFESGPDHWWWYDPDDSPDAGALLTTNQPDQPTASSLYLMSWSETWFAQWGEDWDAAAEYLAELLLIDTDTTGLYG